MRNISVLVILLFCIHFSIAQTHWSPVDESKIPDSVKISFKELHPTTCNVNWGMRVEGKGRLYQASGYDDGGHFEIKLAGDGSLVGKIQKIEHHEVPEAVKTQIEVKKSAGWEIINIYHKLHKSQNYYRAIFQKAGKHLKVDWLSDGSEKASKESGKNIHTSHHVLK